MKIISVFRAHGRSPRSSPQNTALLRETGLDVTLIGAEISDLRGFTLCNYARGKLADGGKIHV